MERCVKMRRSTLTLAKGSIPSHRSQGGSEKNGRNSFSYSPNVAEENADIILRRSGLETTDGVAVSNVISLNDYRNISALHFCTAESRPSLIEAAVSTVMATVVDEHEER